MYKKKNGTSIIALIIFISVLPCIIVFSLQIVSAIINKNSNSSLIAIMALVFLLISIFSTVYFIKKMHTSEKKEYRSFRPPDIQYSDNSDTLKKSTSLEIELDNENNDFDAIKNINKLQELLISSNNNNKQSIKKILTCEKVEHIILNEDISKINNIYELEALSNNYDSKTNNQCNNNTTSNYTYNTNREKEEQTDMSNTPDKKKKKSSITGLIIFLIIMFGRVDKISRATFSNMNVERLIGVIIPITIFIFVIFIVIRISKSAKSAKSNTSNENNGMSISQRYMSDNPKAKKSFYTKEDNNHVSTNYVKNSVSRNTYSNRGNMPTQPFPCENCGNMLKPGTLFCSKCDTKVDYSKFQ